MTITLEPKVEKRLRRKAAKLGQDADALASALLGGVLDEDILDETPNDLPPAPEEIVIAFEGQIERVEEGVATLRLVDQHGRRSVATYAAADLERDHIPAETGASFRCRIARHNGGIQVSFQPVPRRTVSEAHRQQLEDRAVAAYATLQNDY